MMQRLLVLLVLLAVIVPSSLYARWIKDKVVMPVAATGPVEFSHDNHLEAVGSNCPSCHNEIFHIVTEKNPPATMADMEQGKSCGACHNGDRAFDVADDCSMCHPTRPVTVANPAAPALFPHDVHTSMFGCDACHPDLYQPQAGANPRVSMDEMADGASCGACHDGSTAFGVDDSCAACHVTADVAFATDAGEATFSHEVHTSMFGCDSCHPDLYLPDSQKNPTVSMEQMSGGSSCGACHDGSTAFSVDDNCDVCHAM